MNRCILLGGLLLFMGSFLRAQVNDGGTKPVSFLRTEFRSEAIPIIKAPELDMDRVRAEDEARAEKGELFTMGRVLELGIDPQKQGKWETLRNGDRIWRVRIQSPGAEGISLYFSDFVLPKGARLHAYTLDKKHILGGFTSQNNHRSKLFATEYVYGDDIILEYYEPVYSAGMGSFLLKEIGHGYKNVLNFGASGSCMVNANCSEGLPHTEQRDAVARILVRQGMNQGWCTGSMINNVRNDCTPYFLTAMHCGGSNTNFVSTADLNQWIFYFNFQSAGCANPGSSPSTAQSLTGARFVSYSFDNGGNSGSDLLLLELNSSPPASYNVYYAGWNRSTATTTGGFGIHHPSGDIKKFSIFTGTTVNSGWNGSGLSSHWRVNWVATANGHSVTEGGSSGSALFNNAGQIIGTLTGGAASCTNRTAPDYYGKMSYHWESNGTVPSRRLRDWLDPDNTGAITLNGTYAPCTAAGPDAGISVINNPIPGEQTCSSPIIPNVTLNNYGSVALTNVTIRYQIDAGAINNFTWTGNLTPGSTDNVNLPSLALPAGPAFQLSVWTSNPNGVVDVNFGNDTARAVSQYRQSSAPPYSENFDAGALPTDIETFNPNADAFEWTYVTGISGFGQGTGSMMFDNYNAVGGNNPGGTVDWMFLPNMNFQGVTNPQLRFDVAYAPYDATYSDTLVVAVATNCGTTYTPVYLEGGIDLSTTGGTVTAEFAPTGTQWRTETIDLTAYANQDNIAVAFINVSGYGNRMFIDNINVPVACNLTASLGSQTNVSCSGGNDGQASISLTGGTGPYSYDSGTGAQSTGLFTGLSAGTYNITVTDNTGCDDVVSVTITQPASVLATSLQSQNNLSCFNGNDGSFTIAASGGTTPYSFNRGMGAQGTGIFTGLAAGTYTVTVTDANGCTAVRSVTLTQPATGISTSISSQTNVSCLGGSNGSFTVAASGGNAPYGFSIGGAAQGNGTFSNLSAGTYNVTVTDASGCTAQRSVTITQPTTGISTSISSQTNVACFGSNTGSVTVAASGGTAPYSFTRGTGTQGSGTFSGLSAGSYNITVSDGGGCSSVQTVNITQPASGLSASTSSQTNISCFGINDGSFTVAATGGTSPYSFNRGTGAQSTGTFSGLAVGSYTVTVSDANGCSTTRSVSLTGPSSALTTSISSQNNINCFGASDGSFTIAASGGTSPYSFNRGTGPQGTGTFSGLAAGSYTVTVTDANGCAAQRSVTLTQPTTGINTSISSQTNVACFGQNTGSFTVAASNGTAPYSFNRGTGPQATGSFAGLAAGSYNVTVTDASGCSAVQTVNLTQPASGVNATVGNQSNVSCFGESNGSFVVSASGGASPYSFNRGTGAQSTGTFTGLAAATYTVTVSDNNGCSNTVTATIGSPAALNATVSNQSNVSCLGGSNGSATLAVTGGTPSYIFNRGTGPQANSTLSNLAAGSYTVTVSDANGCTTTESFSISEPATALTVSLSTTPTTCAGNDGEAFALVSGGGTPYSYAWSSGGATNVVTGLPVAPITVSVTDANGCQVVANDVVANGCSTPCALVLGTATVVDANCFGACDGTISTTNSGGTAPYSYAWSDASTASDRQGLCAGSYSLTLTDAQGCTATDSYSINEPSELLATASLDNNDTEATVTASGGIAPYTVLWSSGQTSETITGLMPGNYTATVSDANGCEAVSNTLSIIASSLNLQVEQNIDFAVFPNPSSGFAQVDIRLPQDMDVSVRVLDVLGREIQLFELEGRELLLPLNLTEQAAGMYFIVLQTPDALLTRKLIINRQ